MSAHSVLHQRSFGIHNRRPSHRMGRGKHFLGCFERSASGWQEGLQQLSAHAQRIDVHRQIGFEICQKQASLLPLPDKQNFAVRNHSATWWDFSVSLLPLNLSHPKDSTEMLAGISQMISDINFPVIADIPIPLPSCPAAI